MRRWERTSCTGAERWGWFLSQQNSPDGGSRRGADPAFPALLTPQPAPAQGPHRAWLEPDLSPCQLCLQTPEHPAHWLAALRETPSKPHERREAS